MNKNNESFVRILNRIDEIRDDMRKLRDENYKFRQWLLEETGTEDLATASQRLQDWRLASRLYTPYMDIPTYSPIT